MQANIIPLAKADSKSLIRGKQVASSMSRDVKTDRIDVLDSLFTLGKRKLSDLQKTNYWSHTDSDNCDFSCRISKINNFSSWIGEDLYKGPCDISNAINAFEHSPPHKQVLDHNFDYINITIGKSDTGDCYMVFNFAELPFNK